ncbi:MarR family transcriptional regulator [Marinobacter sp. CHS3-4]|uniref:MarR family winged helix-turn-helix transcriptional regulator n=1 Tax=Marinobacter sp. CHS3-4 TaxID=3045174 RepID=UPI0024B4DB31|nr:MarR family transcriptional regulator [Marinobacter sp. CHS3-4]MDI9245361.1 MarR family transcriptional regulator [Marinobacter sp. CHS3-4]
MADSAKENMTASEKRLYFLIQLTAHRLKKHADAALTEAAELTTAQAAALSVVARHEPVSQRFIANELSQRESAVMTMTTRLQKADYVAKRRSATDGRAWDLTITEEGKAALSKMERPFAAINELIDQRLGSDGVDQLSEHLLNLLTALND